MTAHDIARALPDIATLRTRCQALATLDAILSPEWEYRYHSFDAHWGPGEEMASMRNGSGDAYSIVFFAAGAFIRGFDHESPMSPAANGHRLWPGLVDSVPKVFNDCVNEAAFSFDRLLEATVCLWREHGDDRWHAGDIRFPEGDATDGADWLFEVLVDPTPVTYQRFADDCFERSIDLDAMWEIYKARPLGDGLVRRINPDVTLDDLVHDLYEIGYLK